MKAKEAATEFQKILDHPGVVFNEVIGALAHLQLARAHAMVGETAKALGGTATFGCADFGANHFSRWRISPVRTSPGVTTVA
ncbi:MAG TPA: hypothetical protein VEF54_00145 [archaeon]|nr:hypothetical protein [archaeon]